MNPTAKKPIVWSVPFSQRIRASAMSVEGLSSRRPRRGQAWRVGDCSLRWRTRQPGIWFSTAVSTCSFSSAWWEQVEYTTLSTEGNERACLRRRVWKVDRLRKRVDMSESD